MSAGLAEGSARRRPSGGFPLRLGPLRGPSDLPHGALRAWEEESGAPAVIRLPQEGKESDLRGLADTSP
jgi:hypothetical protein